MGVVSGSQKKKTSSKNRGSCGLMIGVVYNEIVFWNAQRLGYFADHGHWKMARASGAGCCASPSQTRKCTSAASEPCERPPPVEAYMAWLRERRREVGESCSATI